VADRATPEKSPTILLSAEVDPSEPLEEPPTSRPPAGPAPAWAWVAIALIGLMLAISATTLAVARNADPSTPEAVEDAKTLVAELEKLNRSLATTNDLMSNAIANAEQLSAKAQAKLASLSSQLADVGGGVGQVRSLLGDQLSKPTRSELGSGQERLQSLKEALAQRSGRLADQELGGVSRDVAAVGNEIGVATREGSSRASTIESRIDALEGRQAETDEFRAQIAELRAAADELRESLQTRQEIARTLAAQVQELRRTQAVLQRRLDSLGPRR
jgi:chromosome segregation ATPase